MRVTRRRFLAAAGSTAAWGCRPLRRSARGPIPGSIVGADAAVGHRLRELAEPLRPTGEERTQVLIIGAGIAGLAAGRRLQQLGVQDLRLLELGSEVGGNSVSGANDVAEYPWGAHYVPLPASESHEVQTVFRELGIVTGTDPQGRPVYREEFLCHDPMERLFRLGRWQEGIVPQFGLSPNEREDLDRFLDTVGRLKNTRGRDGRRVFALPVARSSTDPSWRALDQQTFASWLSANGHTTGPLRWYLNYACRDDFGAGIDSVSAWAGLHYFAARDGEAAGAPPHSVVTWPAGNGWLVRRLAESLQAACRPRSLALRVESSADGLFADVWEAGPDRVIRYRARQVILAVPLFVARRLLGLPPATSPSPRTPWMVANLTLDARPAGRGADLAWDNVLYDGAGLGYVVATHQHLARYAGATVITYYRPLDHLDPVRARTEALARSHADWCDSVLEDLRPAHPEMADNVRRLDVRIWGHGMAAPSPGFLQQLETPPLSNRPANVHLAHSDLSGMSLFEEAFTHGVQAAESAARALGLLA